MYQVLYRKYRPQVFTDVVGQEHITDTLINEVTSGRLSHAYLFTGSRGTGKTSCAKILAKAVNCSNVQNGNPCNACDICRGIDNGSILDVLEIDAASNNGVDNIRDLREEANYTPSVGKFRVYIIDEVHMLSQGAFNALLKTLEEPPEHVKFILATTEIQKLPATILSRCQRYDFKRIRSDAMAKRLNYVAETEGFKLTDDGAMLIARIADGAMRDALSILDQCAGRGQTVDATLVSQVSGIADKNYLFQLSSFIYEKKSSNALSLLNELHENSCDMERLCNEMIVHFRNFLVAKSVQNSRELIVCTDDEFKAISNRAKDFTLEFVIFALDLFQKTLESIRSGANRRTEMEMTIIKLSEPSLETDNSALLQRIAELEKSIKFGVPMTVKPVVEESKPVASITKAEEELYQESTVRIESNVEVPVSNIDENEPEIPFAPNGVVDESTPAVTEAKPAGESTSGEDQPFLEWAQVMQKIFEFDKPLFGLLAGSTAFRRDDFVLIEVANKQVNEFVKQPEHNLALRKAAFEVTGSKCRLGIINKTEKPADDVNQLEKFAQLAKNNGIDVKVK